MAFSGPISVSILEMPWWLSVPKLGLLFHHPRWNKIVCLRKLLPIGLLPQWAVFQHPRVILGPIVSLVCFHKRLDLSCGIVLARNVACRAGVFDLIWNKLVSELLSVRHFIGVGVPQEVSEFLESVVDDYQTVRFIGILSCDCAKGFNTYAKRTNDFFRRGMFLIWIVFDQNRISWCCETRISHQANCLLDSGCFKDSRLHLRNYLRISLNCRFGEAFLDFGKFSIPKKVVFLAF